MNRLKSDEVIVLLFRRCMLH